MKLAWLCYEHDDNFENGYDETRAIILFTEPSTRWHGYRYVKIVPIVYSEIVK